MIYYVRLTPRRVRTAARFVAADPWLGGATGEFSLEECVYLPKNVELGSPRALRMMGTGKVYFLRSDRDGSERLLPEALTELWQTGQIPAEWLPQLLSERKGKVRPRHAVPILHRKIGRWLAIAGIAGALGAAAFFPTRAFYKQGASHSMVRTTPEGWLAKPIQDGQRVWLNGYLPVTGRDEEIFNVTPPKNIRAPFDHRASLAWTRASDGMRLILLAGNAYFPGGDEQQVEIGTAVVLDSKKVAIPPATLARVAREVPGLDTHLVLCENWMLDSSLGVSGGIAAASAMIALVGLSLFLGFLLGWPILKARQNGVRKEMAAILARTGRAPAAEVAHG